ncbi:MAG: hypothetical protein ACYCV7_11685 [Acidimicrobiales bacterium]
MIEAVPGGARIAAVDPTALLEHPSLGPIARDAAERLQRVIDSVASSFGPVASP